MSRRDRFSLYVSNGCLFPTYCCTSVLPQPGNRAHEAMRAANRFCMTFAPGLTSSMTIFTIWICGIGLSLVEVQALRGS